MIKTNSHLFSLQIEKTCLGGLLRYPQVFADIDAKTKPTDFYNETHATIYSVLRIALGQKEKLDKVLLAQKLQNLGVSLKDDVDIFDYIDSISYTQISIEGLIEAFDELVKFRICRELCENSQKEIEFIHKSKDKSVSEIIVGTDHIHNTKIEQIGNLHQPEDIYADLYDFLNGIEPHDEVGLKTPFEIFNDLFGGLRSENGIYAIVSRPKQGKSTWLLNIAEGVVDLNEGCKALICDTEMSTKVSRFRATSSLTNINMWFLESGNWKKNPEMAEILYQKKKHLERLKGKVYHINVANLPVEDVCSIMRRWYYRHVGRGGKAFIEYDYIKLTGERLGENWAEHQAIGEKINRLNEVSNQLEAPLFTAMQLNRSAEKEEVDDSSAIAVSDRLAWFAAWVGLFRRKRIREIEEFGNNWGSHILKPLFTRFQGKSSYGHSDLVKIPGPKKEKARYMENFLNYNIENFNIEEMGTLRDMVKGLKDKPDLFQTPKDAPVETGL
jgi:replicative DNA helicase